MGNNPVSEDADYWATGYKGDFYVATFDDKRDKFSWKFNTNSRAEVKSNCEPIGKKDKFRCNCDNNDEFDVACFYENSEYKTKMSLKRELTSEDSSGEVTIKLLFNKPSKIIYVKGVFSIF